MNSIPHEKLSELWDLWSSRRDMPLLPARGSFAAEEFGPWMGNIGIVEVHREPLKFRVALAGSQIVAIDGADFTGKYLEEAVPPHAVEFIIAPYLRCLDCSDATYDQFSPPGRDHVAYHRLLLPCANDGATIDKIFVGIYADHGLLTRRHETVYDHVPGGQGPTKMGLIGPRVVVGSVV